MFPRISRDERGGPGTGAAAHARGDEHHVGAGQRGKNFFTAFFRRHGATIRVATGSQAAPGTGGPQRHLHVGLALGKTLAIRVHGDELHAGDAALEHAVDGVAARAAHAHHFDVGAGQVFGAGQKGDFSHG